MPLSTHEHRQVIMFACKSCMRRAIFSLCSVSQNAVPSAFRTLATAAEQTSSEFQPIRPARKPTRTANHEGLDGRKYRKTAADWAAEKELQYMDDPFHVATRVKKALDDDDFEHAALITKKATSSGKAVVVSWNHLIDYQLKKDSIRAALKTYNDMKKRGQQPNAQTFTIFFRGCAKSTHTKLALAEAMKMYNNMLTTGRVKPNTIHLNAVLHVCATAEDIESMFTILHSATDALRAPNNLTYTTILNGLRTAADKPPSNDFSEAAIGDAKATAIKRAQAIWEEIIASWRSGTLIIDEELVCAMGRVLLMGGPKEVRSIEDLLDQTMVLEENKKLPLKPSTENSTVKKIDDTSSQEEPAIQEKLLTEEDSPSREYLMTKEDSATPKGFSIRAPGAPALTHALPGRNSLSLVLEALERNRDSQGAVKYWGIFTKRFGVDPDLNNWTRLLKVFSYAKNSTHAIGYLKNCPRRLMTPKLFRVAMKACLRENLSRGTFNNGTQILELMCKSLDVPDVQVLRMYLTMTHAHKRSYGKDGEHERIVGQWSRELTIALDKLWEPYQVVSKKSIISKPEALGPVERGLARNFKAEVAALARKMVAAYDYLVSGSLVPMDVEERMKRARNSINRFVVAHFEEVDRHASKQGRDPEQDDDHEFYDERDYTFGQLPGRRWGRYKV
ncbi:hypothetical protein F5Y16DRAFT_361145 [Xylariaceae sp. FL0255]|nr:hypothetical protein F5Y16DRAFT_361145 [Xylariaceae sp. FL0255]